MSRKISIYLFAMLLVLSLMIVPTSAQDGGDDEEVFTARINLSGTTQGWVDTGADLEVGDIYTVLAGGSINIWPNCEETKAQEGFPDLNCALVQSIGPNGTTAFDPTPLDYPFPGGLLGALVGRIGDNQPFMIGTGGTFTAESEGRLEIAFNENFILDDNIGGYGVEITVPHPFNYVSVDGEWVDLGIILEPGQTFTITASGVVNIWSTCEEDKVDEGYPDIDCSLMTITPAGTVAFDPAEDNYPFPGANVGALVGRVGDGDIFLIGEGGTFTTDAGGPLLVKINDIPEFTDDDQGFFNVVVTLENGGELVPVAGNINDWISSGSSYVVGDTVTLSATGTLDIWPLCDVEKQDRGLPNLDCSLMKMGPTGTIELEVAPDDYPLPEGRVGALVGRFGEDGVPFLVGNGGTFLADADGELQFRINDIFGMDDNSGGYVVLIEADTEGEE